MSESNIQRSPGSIFICYRREDSADVTGRIYDRLVDHFGPKRVFMDVVAIPYGYDFRSYIDQTIKVCSIVIVVIGDKWLAEVDGKRRIDDEDDPVRIEIEAALRRAIQIIPVLTRGASHPTKAMLPASVEDLAYRNGTSIRNEHFHDDVASLIRQMDKLLNPSLIRRFLLQIYATGRLFLRRLRRLIRVHRRRVVPAVGATVILLLTITGLLLKYCTSGENDYAHAVKLETGVGGTRIDLPKAAQYLQRAAAKNVPEAEARLAYWVNNGIGGLAKDNVKAAQWAKKAFADGLAAKATNSVEAQIELAGLYEDGLGVSNDFRAAAGLYQKGADQGYAAAQNNLGLLYQNGTYGPPGMIELPDRKKAAELYQKAADQRYAAAQNNLGWLYQDGQGVTKDLGKAVELYQKAADQGHASAQNNLGWLYQNGEGVTKDFGKAAELYQKAADQGNARAQYHLGVLYQKGQGVPKDLGKARELYQKAADQSDKDAIANLKTLPRH
jgi:TPR repeat protein